MNTLPDDIPESERKAALADPSRIVALKRTRLLDSAPEEAFDRFTRLAVRTLGVPVALVSLVDDHRQFFKSCVGLAEPYATARETPLTHSFCQYTVVQRAPLIISDARTHPTLSQNGAVDDLGVIAYAGMPLINKDGKVLGSFCAIDSKPRDWSDGDLETLRDLAAAVMTEIELREANEEAFQLLNAARRDQTEVSTLLDSTAEGIYGIDLNGLCTFINDSASRRLGYEAKEVLGRNMHLLIHHSRADGSHYPEDECTISEALLRGKGIRLIKETLWRKDGSSFLAEYSSQPVFRDGELTGAVVSFLDITERHEAERRVAVQHAVASILALSTDLDDALPRLVETIAGGLGWDVGMFWNVDDDALACEVVWKTPGLDSLELTDESRQARVERGHGLVGAVWEKLEPVWVADLGKEPRFERIRAARTDGLGGTVAFPVQSGGKVLGVIELLSLHQRSPDADLLRTLAVMGYQLGQFIVRMRAEEELRIATRAIAAASSGITISDATKADIPIIYVNPAFSTITGYAADEVLGRNCRFLQGPDTEPSEVDTIRTAIARNDQCSVVLANYRKDGTLFWNDLTLSPVADASGQVTHFIGIQVDVTARKQIESDLKEAREAAELASEAKSRFLANMSHELRTPLNAVILYSELLQEEAEDRGVAEFIPDLEKIRTAGRHLLSLINSVLDLAKVEAGKTEVHLETFAVMDAVNDVVSTAEGLVQKNSNSFEVQFGDDLGMMYTDLTKLRQILFNLVSNAAKFTSDGHVVLQVRRERGSVGDTIVFLIRDSGIGMSPDQLDNLFQPFRQADESITRKFGGTGLGLALSAQFAELLGGTIDVSSEEGSGTEFSLRLPANANANAGDDEAEASPPPLDGYVLVIDDDPAARDELMRALAEQGIPGVEAASGLDGLRLARSFRPSIIFLDVMMPHVDGWKVLTELKADPELASVPVVMVTLSQSEDLGFLLGAADFLMKPIDQDRLVHVLNRFGALRDAGAILVIDDDAATRAVVRKLLVREGWRVEEAENGRVGLERMAASRPSLVLLDLMMPEMDGFEFIANLRQQPAWHDLPVLVMTSLDLTKADKERLSGTVLSIISKGAHTREQVLREVRELAQRNVLSSQGPQPQGSFTPRGD